MPALPAIRTAITSPRIYAEDKWKQVGLYGDESYSNFFRRLTFSPDGGLLVTPAGQFEDPEVIPSLGKLFTEEPSPSRGRKPRPSISTDFSAPATLGPSADASSCVYIYTRANFARPPVAQLPGFKKASVAVKFNPVLFELRPTVSAGSGGHSTLAEQDKLQDTKSGVIEKGTEGVMDVDVTGPLPVPLDKTPSQSQGHSIILAPAPRAPEQLAFNLVSPIMSPVDSISMRPPTPAASKPGTPIHVSSTPRSQTPVLMTDSIFALPYRMLYAVVTMDTVAIYDTQQSGPFCMLTKLHYDEFTDATWYVPPRSPIFKINS